MQERSTDTVLIDGGSNELIRPHHPEIWKEIMACKQGTKKVDMKLACGRIEPGGMSMNGEVMAGPGHKPDSSTVRWIVPDNRLTEELGIRITKYAGKVTLDKGPLEKPIDAITFNRLPYLSWSDFIPIRNLLANSHRSGRAAWQEGNKKKKGKSQTKLTRA